ncbi:NADH-quinone oxidoreductase subunit NuoE family protein [Lipingzhangella halophila]|uniref:NADH-quinone oxidoreductase subunit NuoE family protein n=1 Tax=Lipingzhangella halophila TaxID=1783352 RepID=UPI002483D24E|nr:NAD(P)H-dependent oxidoreductase subunit E [Lipingzhangella halophila]
MVRSVVETRRDERGPLLVILQDLHDQLGYIDSTVVELVAGELNISRADVHGVVTFYTDFRTEPAGGVSVRLCRAEACKSVGAERVVEHAQQVFGVQVGQTTPDGSVTLDQVFCLGNCALGPAAQVNGKMYGRVDSDRLVEILATTETADPAPATSPGESS